MTPINHLSQGPGNEKLRELLHQYLDEQRKRKAIEACSQTKAKMDELESELSKIVGLDELKLQLRKWAKGMLLDERRKALGLKVGARRPPHMAFLGNPGTGNQVYITIYEQTSLVICSIINHQNFNYLLQYGRVQCFTWSIY